MSLDTTKSPYAKKPLFKSLAIAALMTSGLIQPLLPAFAANAGTQISNTATAEYTDADGTSFTTRSNTVTVAIAEVAGIRVFPRGSDDRNGNTTDTGDIIDFNFDVANTGNDHTDIFIPNLSNITDVNLNATNLSIAGTVIEGPGAAALPTNITAVTGGFLVADVAPTTPTNPVSFRVVVTGTVQSDGGGNLTPGDVISVTLGSTGTHTPTNNNDINTTQNQPDNADASNVTEVRTVDRDDAGETPDDPDGGPINGEREASAYVQRGFNSASQDLAHATIRKTVFGNVETSGSPEGNDDVITYDLSLTVEGSSPSSDFRAAPLDTTTIRLNTGGGLSNQQRILVSDVIPEGTVYTGTATAPTTPGAWTVVYSTSNPATTVPIVSTQPGASPAAEWTTAKPADNLIRRVGFVYDDSIGTTTPLTSDVLITGFRFSVVTSGLPVEGGDVYNLAQVFGTTDDGDDTNNAAAEVVYDESGDNNPNNFNDNGTPPDNTGTNFDPVADTGVADFQNHGVDPGNNTGTGPKGEDNLVTIVGTTPNPQPAGDDLFNGPNGNPNAVGPTNDNDDFTNKGLPASNIVTFTNTVSNPANNGAAIASVTVQPITTAQAETANEDPNDPDDDNLFNDAIPENTVVTLTNPDNGQNVIYTFTAGAWTRTGGNVTVLNLGNLADGATDTYTVSIDLTGVLAANRPAEGTAVGIPIIAFSDDAGDGYDGNETTDNITIDRAYNGFMTLTKEARIIRNGTPASAFTNDLSTLSVTTGDIIEYRTTYRNVSIPAPANSGSVGLNAQTFQVIEDGDVRFEAGGTATDNNWYTDAAGQDSLTNHAQGTTVTDVSGNPVTPATITYYNQYNATTKTVIGTTDPNDNVPVEAYVLELPSVTPGTSGRFTIRRRVN